VYNLSEEVMVQLGGFAPQPMNDMWVSEDGSNWVYCREAEWEPRAWHRTATFHQQLWLYGGTPLNNEMWRLETIRKVNRTEIPLTRAKYSLYEYELKWKFMGNAEWSPRVGFGLLVHMYVIRDLITHLIIVTPKCPCCSLKVL
jgi:hypothetical protein